MKNRLFFILLITGSTVFAQTGSMSISEAKRPPHPKAMLDISATKKGVLIPRVTYDMLRSWDPVTKGLLVYITDVDRRGFWYWDTYYLKWKRWRVASSREDVVAPKGGIMMYSGPMDHFGPGGLGLPGTEAEGWALCNGNNGTPNMEGMFLEGAKSDGVNTQSAGLSGGNNKHTFTIQEMPPHNHLVDPGKLSLKTKAHGHTVHDPGHKHSFVTDNWNIWLPWEDPEPNGVVGDKGGDENSGDYYTSAEKTGITLGDSEPNVLPIEFTFPNDWMQETGGADEFDNRPTYYVLAYIMRINPAPAPPPNSFNGQYNFPY